MITAYMKPTNYCNVGCTHCYLPEIVRANKTLMPMDIFRAAAQLLADMNKKTRNSGVHILWHGGEPLTVPLSFFEQANGILDEILPGHTQSIQTSLIPLREDHIPMVISRFGSHIGSSIDFSQRMIKGSVEAYHELWMQKVDLARKHEIGITPGIVPSKREVGREAYIVDWFVERGFDHFNVDRYNSYEGVDPARPTNVEHSAFLSALFDALMDHMRRSGKAPVVGAIKSAITGVLYGIGGDRWGSTCQSDFVVIEPDGGLNTCPDRSTIEKPFSYAQDGWEEFAKSKFRRKWIRHQQVNHKQDHCMGCENQHWCQSGCPITPNGLPEGEEECSGYKTMLSHVRAFTATTEGRALAAAYVNQDYQAGHDPYAGGCPA